MQRVTAAGRLPGWALLCWLAVVASVEAASGDAAGTYAVTVTQVEVSKDGGATYTTVFSGSQAINIAAVNAGAVAAGLVSGAALEAGTYNTVRVTIGSTMQLKGYVNNSSTTIYTNRGSDTNGFLTNTGAANAPGSDYGISSFTVPPGSRTATTTGLSLPVAPGSAGTVKVAFDTSGVITQSSGIPFVGAPTVKISSQ